MARDDVTESFEVVVLAETEKAILCRFVDLDDREEWIPKSQIDDDSEVSSEDDEGTLVVSSWIAREKGLA